MRFERRDEGDETHLRIEGPLDALSTPELRPVIDSVVSARPRRVLVDLSGVNLIDSSGVGAIVSLYKRLRQEGGDVRVAGLREQPLAIFKLLRLDRVLAL